MTVQWYDSAKLLKLGSQIYLILLYFHQHIYVVFLQESSSTTWNEGDSSIELFTTKN